MRMILLTLSFLLAMPVMAGEVDYRIRVDGLACPYCAYGIEKKLEAMDSSIHEIKLDLEKGLVTFRAADSVVLDDTRLESLFRDAGFSYRSKTVTPVVENTP